jgi:hypothetical protein
MKMTILIGITICMISPSLYAASSKKNKEDMTQKVDAKCYVELVGGGEKIAFWSIKRSQLASLSKNIIGDSVRVAEKKSKGAVYKAHECVELTEDFKNRRAFVLDQATPK